MSGKTAFAACILLLVAWLVGIRPAAADATAQTETVQWLAGVARADITPEESLWMAGYAARTKPAEDALQPLWVKALALQDSAGNRAVLVTSDILGFPKPVADRIRAQVEADYGLSKDQLILSASHTHSAPVIGASLRCIYNFDDLQERKLMDYTASMEARIIAVIGEALHHLQPAFLYSGNGVARFAVNRRNNAERDLTPTSSLKGPLDHATPTLKVVHPDGSVAAILFGYACHATVLDGYQWCGDYPGFAQEALEREYPDATALFFAGCGADQNPIPRRSIALAKQYGATLAAAVARVLEEPMAPLESRLQTAFDTVSLDLAEAPDTDALAARIENSSGYEHHCAKALLERLEEEGRLPDSYAYPVQVWRLGEQMLFVLGGEVVVEYAIGIKERFGQDVFVMGYANDLMAYIPSERVLAEGGYEGVGAQIIYGMPAAWAPGIEERIYLAIEALVASLAK